MTLFYYEDVATKLNANMSATRPGTMDVVRVTDLSGTTLAVQFDVRVENEILRVTSIAVDTPSAGIDRWSVNHLGGAVASTHAAGQEVEVILSAYALNNNVGGADDDTAYMPTAGGTFTGDVEFEGQILDATEASGTNGQVLTKVSGNPQWATPSSGFSNPMTTKGDIIYEDGTPAPNRLALASSDGWVLTVNHSTGLPEWRAASGGGGGGAPPGGTPYYARAQQTTTHTSLTQNAWTKITNLVVDTDPNSNFASDQYTAPVAGPYLLQGCVALSVNSNEIFAGIRINGSGQDSIAGGWSGSGTGDNPIATVSVIRYLNAGDTVQLIAFTNASGAFSVATANQTYLSVAFLGSPVGASALKASRIYRAATISSLTTGTFTPIPFDSKDTGSQWDNSLVHAGNDYFVADADGLFFITAAFELDNQPGQFALRVEVNGAASAEGANISGSVVYGQQISTVVQALAGQTIKVAYYVNNTETSTTPGSVLTWATCIRVGASNQTTLNAPIQSAKGAGNNVSSDTVNLGTTPTGLLLAFIQLEDKTKSVSSISSTNTTWTKLLQSNTNCDIEIWKGVGSGGAMGTAITFTYSGSSYSLPVVAEFGGGLTGTVSTSATRTDTSINDSPYPRVTPYFTPATDSLVVFIIGGASYGVGLAGNVPNGPGMHAFDCQIPGGQHCGWGYPGKNPTYASLFYHTTVAYDAIIACIT
jgi:hypothetical protein